MFSAAKKGKWKVGEDRTKVRKPLECFLCASPHLVKDCPAKAKLAAIVRMEESDSGEENYKGPKKLRVINLQEQSQGEEEPKRVVRLGAMRMLRTSKASRGESSQEMDVREQATERAHDCKGQRRKGKTRRRLRMAKHPSNEGIAGLSGGECHGPREQGADDSPKSVRGVQGDALSIYGRRSPRSRYRRHGFSRYG